MCEWNPHAHQQFCNCWRGLLTVLYDQPEDIRQILQRISQPGQLCQLLAPSEGGRYDVEGWQVIP